MKERVQVEIALVEDLVIKDGQLAMALEVRVEAAAPAQDEHLPFNWELISQSAGLQLMRKMFRVGLEKSDLELIWSMRAGKNGEEIVRMGKRRSIFKTIFGTIEIPRIRIKYKGSGKSETPSSRAWQLPRQIYISRGLKNAVCTIVAKESFSSTLKQIERESGEIGIVSKSTIGNILRSEGEQLAAAQQERAEQVFGADASATVLLGRASAHIAEKYFESTFLNGAELNSEADAEGVFDQINWDPYEELMKQQAQQHVQPALQAQPAQPALQQQRELSEGKAEPAEQSAQNKSEVITEQGRDGDEEHDVERDVERERERIGIEQVAEREAMAATIDEVRIDKAGVDIGSVAAITVKENGAAEMIIAQVDEVVVRKQPGDKRARVVHYNGSVKSGERTYYCSGTTAAQIVYQVGAVLAQLGLHHEEKSLLVLSDCADWITNWANGIGIREKEIVFCWWHLRNRCGELVGEALTNREDRQTVRKILLKYLWRGQTEEALSYVKQLIADYEDGISKLGIKGMKELEALKNYLMKRQPYIPDYQARRKNKEWIASTQIEKFNDWSISTRCKGQGRRWTSAGVAAIAALETARRNGELWQWQQRRELPVWRAA